MEDGIDGVTRRYLILRCRQLPHFDKNARSILRSFTAMLESGLSSHRAICAPYLETFCEDLASLAYGPDGYVSILHPERFMQLARILITYISYHEGILIGRNGHERMRAYAREIDAGEEVMLTFFSMISRGVFRICHGDRTSVPSLEESKWRP
jgi:hypothetical protein